MTERIPDISPSLIEVDEALPRYKSSRQHARALVVQGLYSMWLSSNDAPMVRIDTERALGFRAADGEYFRAAWAGVTAAQPELEGLMFNHLDRTEEELSPIERAILCLGVWELRDRVDIPYKVVINEAVELAKRFGGTDGHKYVNGVLDKLAPSLRAPEWAAAHPSQ